MAEPSPQAQAAGDPSIPSPAPAPAPSVSTTSPPPISTSLSTSQFYTSTVPPLPAPFVTLLETYSDIPPAQQRAHILALRDSAYAIHPYPCLGLFRFLRLALLVHPLYSSYVLPSLLRDAEGKEGDGEAEALFLDLGTCLGQDLRQLRHDGVKLERLWGADLEAEFIELGFKMFKDGERWPRGQMLAPADVFDSSPTNVLAALDGRCTIVQTNSFFHLFSFSDQLLAARRVLRLLKPGPPGTKRLILGSNNGNVVAGDYVMKRPARSVSIYRHDQRSWEEFWERSVVGEEGDGGWKGKVNCKVEVHQVVELSLGEGFKVEDTWRGAGYRWMVWSVWVEFL